MKRLPQFFAVLALAAALFAVPDDEARAHSETNHVSLPLSAWYADWDSINHFIDQHGAEALNVRHDSGETALSFAAEAGHLPVVLTLLALGVDVNLPNYDNITPLHYAGRDGNIPLAEALISAGASLNVKIADPTGPVYTPLGWAGAQEQTAIFPLLIWAGGHWGEPCADGEIASMVPNADPEAPGLWPPSPACVPSPRTRCAAANWDYAADRDVCAINSYEGANLADSGRSNCRTPGAPAGVADASPLCSAAFGAGWDFPTKPTTGDTSPYYVYNCDPNGTLGMIPATVNTVGATECACADAGKVVIGGRQVGVSGTTVTVTAGGRCAVCPNGHILPDGGCAAAAAASVNAALLAEVGKDFPDVADVAAARRALDGGADPNLTTSAGVPVLVAAALGLHAEVVSVLITAGADPLVKVAGIFEGNGGFNIQTLSAFIPGALAERVFLDRKTRAKFPVGRRLAETIIHFGDAAGGKFDWGAVDRVGLSRNGGAFTYTAGELVLGYLQMSRLLPRKVLTPDQIVFFNAIGRYVRARGESCPASWHGVGVGGHHPSYCAARRVCPSRALGEAYSCSRECDGFPLLARNPANVGYGGEATPSGGTCVSACGENERLVAAWPDSQCQCARGAPDARGKCPMLQIEQDLLDETLKESPNIVTIRSLLYRGARANLTLEDGRPLIFAAVSMRHADVLSVLITGGARPDARHDFGVGGFSNLFHVPGRIIWGAHAQLARSDGLTRYTRGETATLMLHFAEAVKIAAATSTVSFPWGVPARVNNSFYYLGQARVAVAVKGGDPEIEAEIEDELSFIGGYLLDQGASCGGGLTAGTAAHTALCLSRRSCPLSGSSVTVVSSCGMCAGSPLRTPAGDSCAAACGDNRIEGAAAGWGERQCELTPAASAANMTLLAEIREVSPDLDVVRAALRAGADPDHRTAETAGSVPALIVAATLGRAKVVSVLVTAGADVNATDPTHPDRLNVVHHLAAPLSGAAAGPRALRASALYYFGGGLDVVGDAAFDWNQENRSGYRALDLLASATTAENQALAGESAAVTYEMATYLLRRGARCGYRTADHSHRVCTGLMATVEYAESPRAGGTLTASVPSGGMVLRGSAATWTAAPAAGWTLAAWAGDAENCAASDLRCVLTAGANLHVTAVFSYVGDCSAGETGVWLEGRGLCVPAADADAAAACAAAGWEVNTRSDSQATYLICAVPAARWVMNPANGGFVEVTLRGTDGRPSGCGIGNGAVLPPCAEVFGSPPQFPEKPAPPDAIPDPGYYVSNCSYDGHFPAIPADLNTIGATECRCAEVDGYTGDDWPHNCCPAGQEAKGGACAALPTAVVEYGGTPDGGGTLTASVPPGGTILQGAAATFVATPAAGWYVAGWNRADCVNIGAAAAPGVEQECALTVDADLFVTAAFAEARAVVYQAGVSASLAGGGGSVNSGDTVADGTTIAFLAAPPENQEVARWTNNGAAVCVGQNPCLLEVSGDLNVRAEFASLLRTIAYAEETPPGRSGGTLTASIPSGGAARRGSTVTFTATPAAGWYVEEWTGDGAGCAPSARECEAAVDGDLFVTVRFAETQAVAALRYAAQPAAGGTVTVAGLIGDTVAGGTTVTFLATPAAGWHVAGWNRGDCANIGAAATPGEEQECVLTADGDLFVRADFAEARTVVYGADISASLADGGGGVNSGDTVADGATIAFLAAPPENREVARWTNNGAAVCAGRNPCLLAADGGGLSVRAEFAPIVRRIAYAEIPDGQRGGTVTASVPSGGTARQGAAATFTAIPAAGWYVEEWTGDGAGCANIGAAATPGVEQECVLTVDADLFVTAAFAAARTVVYGADISASLADGGGRVNSGDTFADGTTIAFLATPPENHAFARWTNNGLEACVGQNPCLLAANGGLSVRAEFAPAMRTIAYAEIPGGQRGGILTASVPSGGTALHGVMAIFVATPAAGWYVAGWSRGDCANVGAAANPGVKQECILTVDADLFVTATFAAARAVVYGAGVSASLADGGGNVNSGDTVADGATIAFLATPPENHALAGWTNNGLEACVGQNPCLLAADADLSARAEFVSLLRTITYTEETLGENVGRGGDLTASVPSGGTAPLGTTVTFTARSAGGRYYIKEWAGDGAGCKKFAGTCEAEVDADLFVTVRFAALSQYSSLLSYAALPAEGGTLTFSGLHAGYDGKDTVVGGAPVTFRARPAAGWAVAAWKGDVVEDCAPDLECTARAYTDLFVTVHFAMTASVEHAIFPEDGRGGTVTVAGLLGEDYAYAGATLTFRALPAAGWTLAAWEGDVGDCAAPDLECALTADRDLLVTARFAKTSGVARLSYAALPAAGGTVTVAGLTGGVVADGATVTFLATPATGWYVAGWSRDDCANIGAAATPGEEQECVLTADADLHVTAAFAEAWAVVYRADVSASLAGGGGRVNSGDTFADGTTIAFSAAPPENHVLARWTNNGEAVCAGQNPCLLAADGGLSVRAEFAPIVWRIVYAEIPDNRRGGILTASAAPSGGTAPQGAAATFTATPAAGWYVAGWSRGDCANIGAAAAPGVEQECVLAVDADLHVTATFAAAWAVVYGADVSASLADGGGNVNSGDTFADGTTIAFLATPPENHVLAGWTNNGAAVCAGQNPCLLAADGGLSVRAEFFSLLRTIAYAEIPDDQSWGTLTASVPSGGTARLGTTATFTATPAAGYYVEEWTGDGAGCAAFGVRCEAEVDADLFVTVRFARQQALSALSYAALPAGGAGGTLTVDAEFSGGDNMVVGGATVDFSGAAGGGVGGGGLGGGCRELRRAGHEMRAAREQGFVCDGSFCADGAGGTQGFSGGRAGRNGDGCGIDRRRFCICGRHAHFSGASGDAVGCDRLGGECRGLRRVGFGMRGDGGRGRGGVCDGSLWGELRGEKPRAGRGGRAGR